MVLLSAVQFALQESLNLSDTDTSDTLLKITCSCCLLTNQSAEEFEPQAQTYSENRSCLRFLAPCV